MEEIGDWTYGYSAWKEDEYIKLKNSLETHGGKDWLAIAVLVPVKRKIGVGTLSEHCTKMNRKSR
jgi:hypothetical protein